MKRFFLKIFITLTPLLALYLIDFVYSQLDMRSRGVTKESWYELMHDNIKANVVVMGNSHAKNHYNPTIIDSILKSSTYNLGLQGCNIRELVPRYNLYRDKQDKPELIIQDINLYTLANEVGQHNSQFFPYFWNSALRKEYFPLEPFSFQEKYLPLYRYSGTKINLKRKPRILEKGYHGIDEVYDGTRFRQVSTVQFDYTDTSLCLFDEYLARNKAEGIKMIFVYSPTYIGVLDKMTNLNEMYSVYQELADRYDIPVLDYTYMGMCYDTTFFANATHLNIAGAKIFSDSLANDLLKLGLIDR